jgi:dCTP deaminase
VTLQSDGGIVRAKIHQGLVIEPWSADEVQPCSYDVRLADEFQVYGVEYDHIDPAVEQPGLMVPMRITEKRTGFGNRDLVDSWYELEPGGFALARTAERFRLPAHLAARVEGKSSIGRLGMGVHTTAGFIDPGFEGTITLELWSVAPLPIRLRPGMRIGQLCLFRLDQAALRPYGSAGLGSRYQGQDGVQPSLLHLGERPS